MNGTVNVMNVRHFLAVRLQLKPLVLEKKKDGFKLSRLQIAFTQDIRKFVN